ncbi:MAG TPA: purine-nucleoside phosphorylase, partial [Devosia sp.]|nr:purine-nucleoside phosphorylase [Devosia sp.]
MTALATIRERLGDVPVDVALVLGSGLAGLVNMIEDATIIPYRDLAGFPGHGSATMVSGHGSDLVIGRLHGKTVAVLTGREHYYERGNAAAMRVPLETLAAMGAKTLMLTNAAGSLDEKARPGDLMLISDHINYAGANPLIGENSD